MGHMPEEFIDIGEATFVNLRHVIAFRIVSDAEAIVTLDREQEALLEKGVRRVVTVKGREAVARLQEVASRNAARP